MDDARSRPVQHILVATDFSDTADAALEVAIHYARTFKARLHLIHVFAEGEIAVTRPTLPPEPSPMLRSAWRARAVTPPRRSCVTPAGSPSISSWSARTVARA